MRVATARREQAQANLGSCARVALPGGLPHLGYRREIPTLAKTRENHDKSGAGNGIRTRDTLLGKPFRPRSASVHSCPPAYT
jgi:hypothetical protein